MKALIVGVPVLRDTRRFHFEKGRRWTVFEHIVLEALAKEDWTLGALEAASRLPRRVLVEILIRLMRMGWVELLPQGSGIVFRSTPLGRLNSTREELPPLTKAAARFIGFAVDQITGSILRGRDLTTATNSQWQERTKGRPAILLKPPESEAQPMQADVRGLADTLLESDEILTRVDVTDYRPRKRIALAAVRGGEIEGLGASVADTLKAVIFEAVRSTGEQAQRESISIEVKAPTLLSRRVHERRPISFSLSDLILDGPEHEKSFKDVFAQATSRLILHSTFIALQPAMAALPLMRACAARGTRIDILWGKSDDKDEVNQTRRAAAELNRVLEQEGINDRIKVHQSSTRSHAKIMLYDLGSGDRFAALVGSCNWLSSTFRSFDATVRLRDPGIVADVAFELAELARPRDGQIPDLSSELTRLGIQLAASPINTKSRAEAQLILGCEHAQILNVARDESAREITLLSHRLGVATKPVLKSLVAAAKARNVRPTVFYGRVSGPVTASDAARQSAELKVEGIDLLPILRPRIHSKVLCWDNDNIVITSLNWLSADPPSDNPRQEIGIHIRANDIAKNFRQRFANARDLE